MATRTRIFKNNSTQAVRLPKAVAFPDSVRDVEVKVVGNSRIITPVGKNWEDWFLHGPRLPDDFDVGEELPPEDREPL